MVSNDTFVREKLNNFCNFLKTCLEKRISNSRYADFKKKLDELVAVDTSQFIMHITQDMLPYKNNMRAYVAKLLDEHDVIGQLTSDELAKCERYVSCFISVVERG